MVELVRELARFLAQLALAVPVLITVFMLRAFEINPMADEIEDWWLHL